MCLSPISISRTYLGRKVVQWCPCGKCEECIKDKQNEYIIRTIEEAMKIKGDEAKIPPPPLNNLNHL